MKNQSPIHLLVLEKLRILFNAEKQLVSYLQVIKNKSNTPALQSLLSIMIDMSVSRIHELNHLFKHLDIHRHGATCEAMNGLIRENLSLLSLSTDTRAKEYAIINFLQQAHHYKSSAYAWLYAHMADHPQLLQAISIVQAILNEEKNITSQIEEVENNLLFLKHFREQLVNY